MEEVNILQLMAQFDFSKPISVILAFEDSDDELSQHDNPIKEQMNFNKDKYDCSNVEKGVKNSIRENHTSIPKESSEVEIAKDKQTVINIENHTSIINKNLQVTKTHASTIGTGVMPTQQSAISIDCDSTGTAQIMKSPNFIIEMQNSGKHMETEKKTMIVEQRTIDIEADLTTNHTNSRIEVRNSRKNIENEKEILIVAQDASTNEATSPSTNTKIQMICSLDSKMKTRSSGGCITVDQEVIPIDDGSTYSNSNTHIFNSLSFTTEFNNFNGNIETVSDENSTNLITENYIADVTKIYSRMHDIHGWKSWVMNLLHKVCADLTLIMHAYFHPSTSRRTQKQLNQLKNYIFNKSYGTVAAIILPQEKNEQFVTKFIDMTVTYAKKNIGQQIERKHVKPVYDDMIEWTKQKRKPKEKKKKKTTNGYKSTRVASEVKNAKVNHSKINGNRINKNIMSNKRVNDRAGSGDIVQDRRRKQDITLTNTDISVNLISETERTEKRINDNIKKNNSSNDISTINKRVNDDIQIVESSQVNDNRRISCDTINEDYSNKHNRINIKQCTYNQDAHNYNFENIAAHSFQYLKRLEQAQQDLMMFESPLISPIPPYTPPNGPDPTQPSIIKQKGCLWQPLLMKPNSRQPPMIRPEPVQLPLTRLGTTTTITPISLEPPQQPLIRPEPSDQNKL